MSHPALARLTRRTTTALVACVLLASTAAAANSYLLTGRVWAHARNEHVLQIGSRDDYVAVRGDHSTDLDCWVYDADERLVSSDVDDTDVCVLPTPGMGRHRLVVRNYGDVYNDYVVETGRR